MRILPKTDEEALDIVYNILNQGDGRYNDPKNEVLLADFIINDAILLEEKEIPNIKEPTKEDLQKLFGVQIYAKYIAKVLLKEIGFKDSEIFFERSFFGSRPDILAESTTKLIPIECYSCRINKIIDYLSRTDEVWVLTRGRPPWEKIPYLKEKMKLFVFRRGIRWYKIFEAVKKKQIEEIKKIPSLL